jgi:DNA-binding beta-propeller fold protein YncE
MRSRPGVLLALLACLLAPGLARAASPPGTLAPLAGVNACVSQLPSLGCTPARGLDDARAVALSPDGRSLYAVAAAPATLTAYSVDPHNGLLQQLNLGQGCLTSVAQTGCADARALAGATALAVSPDGLHVYVASAAAGSVTTFARQPNGALVQLAGIAGCTTTTLTPGCGSAPSLAGADAVAVSPDGRFVYVAGGSADSIIVFARDATTGRIQPLPGAAGCLRANRTGCAPVVGVDSPSAIAISPDGTSLYVTSAVSGTLTAFARDVATGALAQLPEGAGCLSDAPVPGCAPVGGLARATALAITPDGLNVLVAGTDDDAVTSFRRAAAGGALTRVGCVSGSAATPGCVALPLLHGPRTLAVRPDGLVVWVGSSRADSLLTLQLDAATGTLLPTPGPGGCLRTQASVDCRAARALDDPRGIAASADGTHVYVVSNQSKGVAVLGPQLPPNCLRVRTSAVANKPHSIVLACSDPNGDRITLTIASKPRHGRLSGLARATNSAVYTPAPGYVGSDSFRYTASDGLDTSAPGVAAISVRIPPKAPKVRIRTGRTHLLQGGRIHVLVECPAIAIGPCRVATHLVVKGRPAGYGFSRLARRTTGRVVLRAAGVSGRTKAQVVVTVRDKSRRASISRRTITILP